MAEENRTQRDGSARDTMAATGEDQVTIDDPRGRTLALGLGTTATMWAVAYVCRLPVVMAPGWLVLVLLLVAVATWGWLAGRWHGWRAGLTAGLAAGVLDLMILGSLLRSPDSGQLMTHALWWIPGSLVVMTVVAGATAAVAARVRPEPATHPGWTPLVTKVGLASTLLLVIAGGLVTSNQAGLAVPDWPNSEGFGMFLYPLARMTGGIYYEHAHRLFGSLVGLSTLLIAIHLWRVETRRSVRLLVASALVVVVVQGVLGGLRVTGRLTLSASPEDLAPNLALAMVHGVLGQLFFALMVSLAVVTSSRWVELDDGDSEATTGADRSLPLVLLVVLVVQLVLGAVQRHLADGLLLHIAMAGVVVVLALAVGPRFVDRPLERRPLAALGIRVSAVALAQVLLGIGALVATGGHAEVADPAVLDVTLATAHQAVGAVLLALVVALVLWTRRPVPSRH